MAAFVIVLAFALVLALVVNGTETDVEEVFVWSAGEAAGKEFDAADEEAEVEPSETAPVTDEAAATTDNAMFAAALCCCCFIRRAISSCAAAKLTCLIT